MDNSIDKVIASVVEGYERIKNKDKLNHIIRRVQTHTLKFYTVVSFESRKRRWKQDCPMINQTEMQNVQLVGKHLYPLYIHTQTDPIILQTLNFFFFISPSETCDFINFLSAEQNEK